MLKLLVALLILFLVGVKANLPAGYIRNEDTDEDALCNNLNLTVKFTNLQMSRLTNNFLSSPLIYCLNVSNNGILEVDTEAFSSLPNLRYLDLSGNRLRNRKLNEVMNLNFPELQILILNSSFEYYNYYSIELLINGSYPKLRKLFLNNNRISSMITLKENIFPSLTHLYLAYNPISTDKFDWLPETLEYLDITGHKLETLTLRYLKNLKNLFIDQSQEKSLQNIILDNLVNLEYLSLPSNSISEISSYTFINTTSLLYVDLSDNGIRYIEEGSFDSMQKLNFLNLSNNFIEVIQPNTFEKLINLKELVLEKNLITVFPMMNDESNLESISLNCNLIKSIKSGTFGKFKFLKSLFLHDNEISKIDKKAFTGLNNLEILTLSNNNLHELPDDWMTSLTSLEHLDLTGNNFIELGNLALTELSPLKNLYLSKQLQYIGAQSFLNVPENVTIDMSDFKFIEKCNKNNEKYSGAHRNYG